MIYGSNDLMTAIATIFPNLTILFLLVNIFLCIHHLGVYGFIIIESDGLGKCFSVMECSGLDGFFLFPI